MTEAPTTRRHASHADLPSYETKPHALVDVRNLDRTTAMYPQVARIIANLVEAAQSYGLVTEVDAGGVVIGYAKTEEELDKALEQAQKSYDIGRADYIRVTEEPGWWPKYTYALGNYCDREHIPTPTKPEPKPEPETHGVEVVEL